MNSSAVTDLKVEVKLLHKCLLCIADRLRRFREGSHGSCLASQAQDSALLDTQGQTKSHVMPAKMGKKPIFVLFCSQVHLKLKEYAYTTIAVSCKSCQPFKVKPSFSGKPSVPRIAYPVWLNIKPHCCSLIHQVLMCLLIPLPFFLRIQRWEESLSELIPQQDMFEKCQYDFGKERKKSPFVVVYVATTMAAVNLMPECNYNAMLVW